MRKKLSWKLGFGHVDLVICPPRAAVGLPFRCALAYLLGKGIDIPPPAWALRQNDYYSLSMSGSLSRFSGWRSRSLSLSEGLTDSTGARDGTRADAVLDRGRRRLFHF